MVGLLLVEVVLRASQDCVRLRELLYMPGFHTKYDESRTLPELLDQGLYKRGPFEKVGDYVLNSRGLRTHEYMIEKASNTHRIVVLGDSHSFSSGGVPYALLWHQRMAAMLRAEVPVDIELINLSIPAVGPGFELRMWQLEGRRLAPDTVILAMSVGNDFIEMLSRLADRSWMDRLARQCFLARLVRNVAILSATPRAAHEASTPSSARVGGYVIPDYEGIYDRTKPQFRLEQHEHIVYSRCSISDTQRTQVFEVALEGVAAVLAELQKSANEIGAEFVLLLIPDEHQVHPEILKQVAESRGRNVEEFDVDRAQRSLRVLCEDSNIHCVDALDVIRVAGKETPMYRPRETHLNDIGHGHMAELIAQYLLKHDLVD